jgi:hypothetical protein
MALITAEKREVGTVGTQQVQSFSIKANGKAFKVLIDGLYSDKIKSVIRELWTNAYDAHVMADNSAQPFECQLPTVFDPSFRVRDYGISMTHHGVMHLYSTVFESSKEGTNEQVGKLGLGSKSPFAYTDTFAVTAWMDGEKRLYSAFIGEDYIPQIAHMLTEPSDEPEGIEVSFPVKMSDISAFTAAAEKVIIGFETRPTVKGQNIGVREMVEHKRGDNWVLYKEMWDGAITQAHARQGCVLYPLDANAITGLTSNQCDLLNAPIVINFPIGSLEITANREGLGYDKTTCENIVAELDVIIDTLSAEFVARLHAAKTMWDALVIRKEIMSDGSIPKFIRTKVGEASFKGFDLTQRRDWTSWKGLVRPDIHITKIERHDITRRQTGPKLEKENNSKNGGFHFEPGELRVYLHDPKDRVIGPAQRIMNHYNAHRYDANAPHKFLYVRVDKNSAAFKRLLVKLGRPPVDIFVDVATLPEIPKEQKARAVVKMKRIDVRDLVAVDVDFDAGGYYVPLLRDGFDQIPAPFGLVTTTGLNSLFKDMITHGLIPTGSVLYGMPKSLARHANKDEWVNFWDIAKAFFDTHYDADKVGRVAQARRLLRPDTCYTDTAPKLMKACALLRQFAIGPADATKSFGMLLAKLESLHTMLSVTPEQSLIEKHLGMTKLLPSEFDSVKEEGAIKALIHDVYSAYPMLGIVANTGSTWGRLINPESEQVAKIVIDYVNLIDSQP